jgi:hypothetical protein
VGRLSVKVAGALLHSPECDRCRRGSLSAALREARCLAYSRLPNSEDQMSIVVRYAPVPSSTIEQYDEVMRRLQESGEMPADGFEYHVAFLSDGQLLVSEVWDSQQHLEAFGARIMPLLADVALEHSGQPEIFEVHNIIRR